MSVFGTYTCSECCTSLVSGCVDCATSSAVPNVSLHNRKIMSNAADKQKSQWCQCQEQKWISKQKLTKQMTPDTMRTVTRLHRGYKLRPISLIALLCFALLCFALLCFAHAVTLRKVVRQQIWGEVAVLLPTSFANPFWI